MANSDEETAPVTFSDCGGAITDATIAAFEQSIGATLPSDYRQFLLTHNGGDPSRRYFRWGRRAYSDSAVRAFYFLGDVGAHPSYRLENNRQMYQGEEERIPRELLPIGDDEGGNQICLAIRGDRYGQVFFWHHEREGRRSAIQKVADSFTAFVSSLTEDTEVTRLAPVYVALAQDTPDGLSRLIDEGLSPDLMLPNDNWTILENSAFCFRPEFTRMLLEKGARKNIENAIELARKRGNKESLDILQEYIDS